MEFQRIIRSDPEKIFIVVKNSYSTATMTAGQVAVWDWTTDINGVGVTFGLATENVSNGMAVAGVIAETIAHNDYGLCQVYGYCASASVHSFTASGHVYHESRGVVAAGTPLVGDITAASKSFAGITIAETAQVLYPTAFALAAQASFTTKRIAVFIKAL